MAKDRSVHEWCLECGATLAVDLTLNAWACFGIAGRRITGCGARGYLLPSGVRVTVKR